MKQFKKFNRNKEDFICEVCDEIIKGNGYTNHCTNCFYSKHVDINPGDRKSDCGGLMELISYENHIIKGIVLYHKCMICSYTKSNKISSNDNIDNLFKMFENGLNFKLK